MSNQNRFSIKQTFSVKVISLLSFLIFTISCKSLDESISRESISGGGKGSLIVIDTFHNAVETGFEIFARRVAISDNPRQNSLVTTFEENKIKSKINDDKTESDVRIKIGVVIVYIFDRDASGNETKKEIELDEKRLRELKFTATKSNGEVGAYNVITFLQGQEGHLIGDNPGLVDQLFAFLKAM